MRHSIRLGTIAVILCGAMALSSGATLAQDSAVTAPVTPNPSLCTAEPRTADELLAIFASATPISGEEEPTSATIPLGPEADPATVEAITSTIHGVVACLNAGDYPRFLGTMTDAAVAYFSWLGPELASGSFPAELTGEVARPESEWSTVYAVSGVSRLAADGRVGCIVTLHDPTSGITSPETLHLVLTLAGDRWLIDAITELG